MHARYRKTACAQELKETCPTNIRRSTDDWQAPKLLCQDVPEEVSKIIVSRCFETRFQGLVEGNSAMECNIYNGKE